MEGQRRALKNYWKSEKILIKHLYSPSWNFLLNEETPLQPLIFKIAWSVLPLCGGIFHILPPNFPACHRRVPKILPEPVRCRIKPLETFWGKCVQFCCCSLAISPAPFSPKTRLIGDIWLVKCLLRFCRDSSRKGQNTTFPRWIKANTDALLRLAC